MTRINQIAITLSILAVGLRLLAIDQPFVDRWSWRESDVAAIAQNFHRGGHFAYPQVDWAGDQPGYVGTEFPILPFAAALSYKLLGVHDWIGRIQAVIFFAISLPFFFFLTGELFEPVAAVWALLFYAFAPLNFFAGREFMPDAPSLSLAIVGLYLFKHWLTDGSWKWFWVSAVCVSLSLLIKLPSILIGAPLAYFLFERYRLAAFRRPALWLYALFTLVPSAIWYGHAYMISENFYPHHFFGAGGIQIMSAAWYWKIAGETTSGLTPILLGLGIVGLFLNFRRGIFQWWLAATLLFIFVVGYGNRHPWYQLPMVPIMAAFAGGAFSFFSGRISGRWLRIALASVSAVLFALLSFTNVRPLYLPTFAPLYDLGLELKRVTPENSLIVAADNGNPVVFYYAERKGWHFPESDAVFQGDPSDSTQAIADLEFLRRRGASYFAVSAHTSWWLDYYPEFAQHLANSSTLMESTSAYKIYRLNPVQK